MEIARRHLRPAELEELLARNPDAVVEVNGEQVDNNRLGQLLRQTEPAPTVDEPFYLEGTRNQRRVQKKLMRKATKAGKRK